MASPGVQNTPTGPSRHDAVTANASAKPAMPNSIAEPKPDAPPVWRLTNAADATQSAGRATAKAIRSTRRGAAPAADTVNYPRPRYERRADPSAPETTAPDRLRGSPQWTNRARAVVLALASSVYTPMATSGGFHASRDLRDSTQPKRHSEISANQNTRNLKGTHNDHRTRAPLRVQPARNTADLDELHFQAAPEGLPVAFLPAIDEFCDSVKALTQDAKSADDKAWHRAALVTKLIMRDHNHRRRERMASGIQRPATDEMAAEVTQDRLGQVNRHRGPAATRPLCTAVQSFHRRPSQQTFNPPANIYRPPANSSKQWLRPRPSQQTLRRSPPRGQPRWLRLHNRRSGGGACQSLRPGTLHDPFSRAFALT